MDILNIVGASIFMYFCRSFNANFLKMDQLVSITVKLCNRVYKIKVAAENESTVRKTAQAINDTIANMKKNFPGRDEQDYMAMALIDYMTSVKQEPVKSASNDDDIAHQLKTIQQLLDQ
jgi:cell division protein ZapA